MFGFDLMLLAAILYVSGGVSTTTLTVTAAATAAALYGLKRAGDE